MMASMHIPQEESLEHTWLAALQQKKLHAMLAAILPANKFYQKKLGGIVTHSNWQLADLPFTTRAELEADQLANPIYGTNLSYPLDRYCRFHQTSGTGGKALRWLDTLESWQWFERIWAMIFAAARVEKSETVFFPFSFGPFVGFWGAFSGGTARGNLCIPAGGMTTSARLKLLLELGAGVICCTPTYALHMAETAAKENIPIKSGKVRAIIVAGEPGGSVPEVRARIESAWNARVFDHTGMTEIGPLGFECFENPLGVHLAENECIPEVIDAAGNPIAPDSNNTQHGELVLTNLGRWGSPLIRYRTGDIVQLNRSKCACGRSFARMVGGILGRVDDLVIIRGNNIFPAAIDAIMKSFSEIAEYQVETFKSGAMTEMKLRIEADAANNSADLPQRVGKKLQDVLNLRCEVQNVPRGTLPRFELKAKRWIRSDRT
jgi:phenylacetate-CoA ligase